MDSGSIIGIFSFVITFALIALRVPLFVGIMMGAFFGFTMIGGIDFALSQFSIGPYEIAASYTFAIIPLFLVMGLLAGATGAATGAFNPMAKWLAPVRGGLLMATVIANIIFGACSSMPLACLAVFSKVAIPELDKNNISRSVSIGTLVASASLDALIPPSTIMVILAMVLDLSVGRLLIAGIVPGLMVGGLFMLLIYLWTYIDPKSVPPVKERFTWKEKFVSLKDIWPIAVLFTVSIGGIYFGWFTPTAAGAVGAFAAVLYAVYKRTGFKLVWNTFGDTAKLGAQLFPMVLAGFIFSRTVALSHLPEKLLGVITESGLPLWGLMAIIIVFYVIIGAVMELLPMLMITLPIIFPAVVHLGYDPTAFVIIIVLLGACDGIVPPIGMQVFAAAALTGMKVDAIFKSVMPYFIVLLIAMAILIAFPQIVTFLPDMMAGG